MKSAHDLLTTTVADRPGLAEDTSSEHAEFSRDRLLDHPDIIAGLPAPGPLSLADCAFDHANRNTRGNDAYVASAAAKAQAVAAVKLF